MSFQTDFATHVRDLRKRAGLSQTQLAQRSGVHLNTVSQIERAVGDPRLSSMLALCAQLNIQIASLHNGALEPADQAVDIPTFLRKQSH